ncbi:MAG TPA: zf-HC2 domain-containing protein [Bryobacteraceae bacterium]|nr:zf-HC2 domain-containing protein [Bryobacteraceae bacterium]
MTCPIETGSQEALLQYSSGKLTGAAAALVEQHMESCSACREFVRAQRAVWTALESWEAGPVPADFDRRLYERIEQTPWWEGLLRPFRPLAHRGLPAAAAAAGVMMIAGYLLDSPPKFHPPAAPQSAAVETLKPEQIEHALDQIEMLHQFDHVMRGDASHTM